MTNERRIFSSRIVTADEVLKGEIVIANGHIAAVEKRGSPAPGSEDWGADAAIPGLIDIHTDNLEKHFAPRPGALWDAVGAAMAHDAQCAAAGITTVFDSLSFHGMKDGLNRREALDPMIAGLDQAASGGALRVEHLWHLRCEVTNADLMDLLLPHAENPRLKLLSVMDHSPGQRQMANMDGFRKRLAAQGKSETELAELAGTWSVERDHAIAPENRRRVVALARTHSIPLAAHDDETVEHVQEAFDDGCAIAEFPVTMAAAQAARKLGMLVAMGAPNFVRGGSHSGNLSARAAAGAGVLDILASDYVPLSMLRAAFMLTEAPFNWTLPQAMAAVALNPARSCGLHDRGLLAQGLRADIVRAGTGPNGWPVPREVWCAGRRVA
jgi:alpha-D-ribose 1-methylphosphonate 5-triphosphate diphosphatase